MERRGSGMKKIIDSYKKFERLTDFHAPEFHSNASEFHVVLWNLNYDNSGAVKEGTNGVEEFVNENEQFANQQNEFANSEKVFLKEVSGTEKEFLKENGEVFVKEFVKGPSKFAKEFVKASRQIYKLISQNPQINAVQMAESMRLSARQVQKYLKRLQESGKIIRVGGRKMGEWKIIDEDYEGFFDRI